MFIQAAKNVKFLIQLTQRNTLFLEHREIYKITLRGNKYIFSYENIIEIKVGSMRKADGRSNCFRVSSLHRDSQRLPRSRRTLLGQTVERRSQLPASTSLSKYVVYQFALGISRV